MEPAPEGIPLGVLDALGQLCLDLQMGTPLWANQILQVFMTFRQEQLTSKKPLADFVRSDMPLFRGAIDQAFGVEGGDFDSRSLAAGALCARLVDMCSEGERPPRGTLDGEEVAAKRRKGNGGGGGSSKGGGSSTAVVVRALRACLRCSRRSAYCGHGPGRHLSMSTHAIAPLWHFPQSDGSITFISKW